MVDETSAIAQFRTPANLAFDFRLELQTHLREVNLLRMADLNYQRMILGYHGCDADVAAKALSGEDSLAPSGWALGSDEYPEAAAPHSRTQTEPQQSRRSDIVWQRGIRHGTIFVLVL